MLIEQVRKLSPGDGRRDRWGTYLTRFYQGFSEGPPGECWNWTKSVDSSGYGQVKHLGKILKAHRISYEVHVGKIPDGLCVLHKCDNPSCVNPNHLRVGTKLDNTRDMISKGRARFKEGTGAIDPLRGEDNPGSVLTESQVAYIRRVYIARHPQFGQCALARKFSVSQGTIHRVVYRKCWNHVN